MRKSKPYVSVLTLNKWCLTPSTPAATHIDRYIPEDHYMRLLVALDKAAISEDELDRRAQAAGGCSLPDLWERIGNT